MSQQPNKIVFLTGGGPLYWIIANALVDRFGPITIIEEGGESAGLFFKRRRKKLGAATAIGQLGFTYVSKAVSLFSRTGRDNTVRASGGNMDAPSGCTYYQVNSVNDPACQDLLRTLNPAAIMVVGTRMIAKATLDCVAAPFINYHPGITPTYRGMNGVYWSRVEKDTDNIGVTLHLVDEAVDTGDILYQKTVDIPAGNNITTYNHYCAVEARPLAIQAIEDAIAGTLKPTKSNQPSRQWFPPTAWGYVWNGVSRGVW